MAITSLHFSATCSASSRTHKTLFPASRDSTIIRSAWAASTLSSRNVCNREMWGLVKPKNGVLKGRRGLRGVIRAEMFGQLTSDLKAAWNKLKGEEVLIKENIVEPMIDIKKALLEADVSLPVVRRFVRAVSKEAVGLGFIRGLRPDQQLVKILRDELVRLMGGEVSELVFEKSGPTVILLAGLKGVGKTTVCAKLALYLKKKGKSCMLVAGDVYRPAAIDQLVTLGEQVDVPVYTAGTGVNPEEIAKQGLQEAKRKNLDVVIMDTAGRLQIDKTMMDELKEVKRALNPTEVLLVVDAMTGQEAAALVSTFNLEIGITGAILTKLDRDLRGGAVLSVKEVSGKPIKLVGLGERMEDLEPFYPALMAGRVLGKGVGLSPLEMAQVYVEDAEEIEKKILNDEFDFNDMLKQIRAIAPTGTVSRILELTPEVGEFSPAQIREEERSFKIMIAMMEAMTPEERGNPEILIEFPDRRLRVAQDAGTTASQVNRLIADLLHMRAGYKKLVASRAPPGSKKSDSRSKLFAEYLVSKPRPYLKSGFKKK